MENWLKCYATYTFSTSPHSCYRTTLLNTKVSNFTVSQENCEKIMPELCLISINLITSGRYMTKKLKLYAWCSKCGPPHGHKRWDDGATGRDSSIHDRLVKASPLVIQTHFKFVDVSYSGSVNFLLDKAYTPDAIVVWVQIRWIRRPQCWRNEVRHLSLQERDGVACSMRQCTVLLKDKTQPWDFRNMSGSSVLARRLSR